MYAYFNGIVKDIESTYIVIDVNGVGYQIFVANPYEYEIGNQYQVYIYNHIKEDEYSLYGFKNKGFRFNVTKALNMIIIILLPLIWYFVLRQHSFTHSFLEFRTLMPMVWCLFSIPSYFSKEA